MPSSFHWCAICSSFMPATSACSSSGRTTPSTLPLPDSLRSSPVLSSIDVSWCAWGSVASAFQQIQCACASVRGQARLQVRGDGMVGVSLGTACPVPAHSLPCQGAWTLILGVVWCSGTGRRQAMPWGVPSWTAATRTLLQRYWHRCPLSSSSLSGSHSIQCQSMTSKLVLDNPAQALAQPVHTPPWPFPPPQGHPQIRQTPPMHACPRGCRWSIGSRGCDTCQRSEGTSPGWCRDGTGRACWDAFPRLGLVSSWRHPSHAFECATWPGQTITL